MLQVQWVCPADLSFGQTPLGRPQNYRADLQDPPRLILIYAGLPKPRNQVPQVDPTRMYVNGTFKGTFKNNKFLV